MKRTLLLIALISLTVLPGYAQKWDSINANNASCVVGACVYVDLDRSDSFAVVQVTGTFSATLQFEASANGTTFVSISGTPSGGGSAVTSATAAGAWRFTVSGYKVLRVRASAYTSGTAIVKISVSNAASSVASSSSLPDPGEDGACMVSSSGEWTRGDCSGEPITNITGNAGTATSLAANGANCPGGQAAAGVDASGVSEGCFTPSGALPSGVASDGADGLAVTGKVTGASLESTGTDPHVLIPDGGTPTANWLTSGTGAILKWGTTAVSLADHTHTGMVTLIASGTVALPTDSIAAGQCATAVSLDDSDIAATDTIQWTPNADISGVTGYTPSGTLRIYPYPASGKAYFKVCNGSASDAVTPGAVTLNVRVTR